MNLPYRPNVGAVVFNRSGKVLVARRTDLPANADPDAGWQLPQGGLDPNERPGMAILRELEEEIGTHRLAFLGECPGWLGYDIPLDIAGFAYRADWRGQKQKWFAFLLLGPDSDIRLDLEAKPEFSAWKWVDLESLPHWAVGFKRGVYAELLGQFQKFA
jgi:putative (di)nucleoside polyphosphate hydrolase